MSLEVIDPIDSDLRAELDDDTSSMHTESEDLNSPQVEINTENELGKCKQSFLYVSHISLFGYCQLIFSSFAGSEVMNINVVCDRGTLLTRIKTQKTACYLAYLFQSHT